MVYFSSDMVVEEELIDNQETETPMGLTHSHINKGTPLKELIQRRETATVNL
jgi:hypothetical protein